MMPSSCAICVAVSSCVKTTTLYVNVVVSPVAHAASLQCVSQSMSTVSASRRRSVDATVDSSVTMASGCRMCTALASALRMSTSPMVPSAVTAAVSTTTSTRMTHAGSSPGASGGCGGGGEGHSPS